MPGVWGWIVLGLAAVTAIGYWWMFVVSVQIIRRWRATAVHTWTELWTLSGLAPDVMRALVAEGLITPAGEGKWRADASVLEAARSGWVRLIYGMPASWAVGLALTGLAGMAGWRAWHGQAWEGVGWLVLAWACSLPSWIWLIGHIVRHVAAGEPEQAPERPWSRDRWM